MFVFRVRNWIEDENQTALSGAFNRRRPVQKARGWIIRPMRTAQQNRRSRRHGKYTSWIITVCRYAVLRSRPPISADQPGRYRVNVKLSASVCRYNVQSKPHILHVQKVGEILCDGGHIFGENAAFFAQGHARDLAKLDNGLRYSFRSKDKSTPWELFGQKPVDPGLEIWVWASSPNRRGTTWFKKGCQGFGSVGNCYANGRIFQSQALNVHNAVSLGKPHLAVGFPMMPKCAQV